MFRQHTMLNISTITSLAVTLVFVTAAGGQIDFATDVQPILADHCVVCHGPTESESGLNLIDSSTVGQELESGDVAIVPRRPADSSLWNRIQTDDPDIRMPLDEDPLTDGQQEIIRRWIEEGAPWTSHWALEPVLMPSPPNVSDKQWLRNPIDAFILRRLEEANIVPARPAPRQALLRRVYYDLTGLPPTPDQVRQFQADPSDDAYEKTVDRLLDSPQYGERWGRHWLDLVRFAETNSYERDNPKPNAWRYRDYVIRCFNEDKPFDQFIREQLAGDELAAAGTFPKDSSDPIIATGYYRLGLWDDEPVDATQAYYDHLDDVVSTTAQVFLGLTINCARCHDHKIDPIPQRDYYRFMAFFHNILNNITKGKHKDSAFTLNTQVAIATPEQQSRWKRDEANQQAALAQMDARLESLEAKVLSTLSRAEREDAVDRKVRRRLIEDKLATTLTAEEHAEWQSLQDRRESVRKQHPPEMPMALAVRENGNSPPPTYVLVRGNAHVKGEEVRPGFPQLLDCPDPAIPLPGERDVTCGRRTVLANWIASADNQLTTRVVVNRIWQHHFGRGIVASSSNFGFASTPPTHPRLLDWLAHEFVRNGWSFKRLHRLMMNSATYRMSASPTPSAWDADPENRLFSRQNMRRLTAEEIRDSILAVSGQLNPKMGGPSIYPEINAEVLQGQSRPGYGWPTSPREQQNRRSVYIHAKRSLVPPLLATFDMAEADISCPVRFTTTQPTQALELFNGVFAHEQAKRLAQRVLAEVGVAPRSQVRRLLWLATQRAPTEAEVDRGRDFVESLQRHGNTTPRVALEAFCLAVLNLNEFVYLD